jgi:hypothetical protein
MHPSPTYPMRLLISLLVFTLVRPTALALVPTRMARHPKRVCSPQQPQAGSIEMAGWMCKSKNGNGNCNSDEDDDIADMICTMKISLEEIKGNRAAMNAGMEDLSGKITEVKEIHCSDSLFSDTIKAVEPCQNY